MIFHEKADFGILFCSFGAFLGVCLMYDLSHVRCKNLILLTGTFFCTLLLTLNAARAAETVTLACNEFPPHKMRSSPDGLPGFDVEILQQAFARVGTRVTTHFMPWKRALSEVRTGNADGLCSCSRHPDRDSWLRYSDVMGTVGIGVFVKPGLEPETFKSWKNLATLKVGVVRAYNLHQELKASGLVPKAVNNDTQGVKMLLKQRLDAFVTFRDTGLYILAQEKTNPGINYRELRSSPYFACFRAQYPT
jgi:polar amino acid transport system substrate-binding protein